MSTSLKDIAGWFERGVKEGADYLIVVCDTFDHEDYPTWVHPGQDFWEKYDSFNGKNMQRIMEVYDLRKSWQSQTAGRAWNVPERAAVGKSEGQK